MFDEQVFVVLLTDAIAKVVQILAVFTERAAADAFADAQPRYWRRRYSEETIAVNRGADPEDWSSYWRDQGRFDGSWLPCAADETYDQNVFDLRWIEIQIAKVPWNPVLASWTVDEARCDELRAIVLEAS